MDRKQKIQVLKDIQEGKANLNELTSPTVKVKTIADLAYTLKRIQNGENLNIEYVEGMQGFSNNLIKQ